MRQDDARRLLDRTKILRNACDLDLFIFFVRHPHTLLSSESLATFLGYDLKAIADSLEVLLAGGLLHRKQTSAHAARLYVLAGSEANDDWAKSLLGVASTRPGRLALKQALLSRSRESASGPDNILRANTTTVTLGRRQSDSVRRPRRRRGR